MPGVDQAIPASAQPVMTGRSCPRALIPGVVPAILAPAQLVMAGLVPVIPAAAQPVMAGLVPAIAAGTEIAKVAVARGDESVPIASPEP